MMEKIRRNQAFLRKLFLGKFPGHGVIITPEFNPDKTLGDFTLSDRPVSDWLSLAVEDYRRQIDYLEILDDDAVPFVGATHTNTGVFASAFGCPIHRYQEDTPAAALPIVETPQAADRLAFPGLNSPILERIFEFARLIRREIGPDVPISVPDIQSPFDIAALVWKKEELLVTLVEAPEAVLRLTEKCYHLLMNFWTAFRREIGNVNFHHCPVIWAPPEMGVSLSEDEAGALSNAMFEQFCLPWLVKISEAWGGLSMHCCAAADHQYPLFRRIPNLRALNRVFTHGPEAAIRTFSGHTVLALAWHSEEMINHLLDIAGPETRFLFNMIGMPLDQARPFLDRFRKRIGR